MARDSARELEFRQLKRVHDVHCSSLMSLPNVVGVGIGYKEVGGESTTQLAIRVYVTEKLPLKALEKQNRIPAKVENAVTDVIESGEMRVLDHAGGDCISGPTGTGTLGGLFYDQTDGAEVILSNSHVITWGDFEGEDLSSVGDPLPVPPEDAIATLKRWKEFKYMAAPNYVDCAIAEVITPGSVSFDIRDIGTPVAIRRVRPSDLGLPVQKTGCTTGHTQNGIITDIYYACWVTGLRYYAFFRNQIYVSGVEFTLPGDSGSLLLDMDNYVLGLCFAGTTNTTAANRITTVCEILDINLYYVPTPPSMPAPEMIYVNEDTDEVRYRKDYNDYLVAEDTYAMGYFYYGGCGLLVGDQLHAAWIGYSVEESSYVVWFASSRDGITWSSPIVAINAASLGSTSGIYGLRLLARPDGALLFILAGLLFPVGEDSRIRLQYSRDGGLTWEGISIVNEQVVADMAIDIQGNLYVVGAEGDPSGYHCRKLLTHDMSFSDPVRISDDARIYVRCETDASGNIHVVGQMYDPELEWRCYHWVSGDGGETFSEAHMLDSIQAYSTSRPQLSIDGEVIHVFWWEKEWDPVLGKNWYRWRYSRSDSGGLSWDPSISMLEILDSLIEGRYQGVPNSLVKDGTLTGVYCGDESPYLHCGALVSDDGLDWEHRSIFAYAPGEDRFESSLALYFGRPAGTFFFLA